LRFPDFDGTVSKCWQQTRPEGFMSSASERRTSRRFTMTLPLSVKTPGDSGPVERKGETKDVSFRGLYFLIDSKLEPGSPVEFVLTLPKEITMAGDVHIRCFGQVVRVDDQNGRRGVAARIERYEFLPAAP
jgi:hypothetical protein